jgi:hypothetical protein
MINKFFIYFLFKLSKEIFNKKGIKNEIHKKKKILNILFF